MEKLKEMFRLSAEAVLILNENGDIVWHNDSLEKMFNTSQIIQLNAPKLIAQENIGEVKWPPDTNRAIKRMILGQLVSYVITPIPQTDYYFVSLRHCENEDLRQINHDVKSRLNSILGFADLVRDNLINNIYEPINIDLLESSLRSGYQLSNQLNRFLAVSRLSEGIDIPKKSKINMMSFLKEIKISFDAEFSKHNLTLLREPLDKSLDLTINADKALLLIAMENALRNAAEEIIEKQFTENSKRQVIIGFGRYASGIIIQISNYCALSETDFQKMFQQKFSTKHNGNGLGTNAIRIIVEAHGGKINTTLNNGIISISLQIPD